MENELTNRKYEESLKVIYDKSISNYLEYLLDLRYKIIFSVSDVEKTKLRKEYEKIIIDFREDLESLEDLKDQVLTLNITKRLTSNYNLIKEKYLKLKEQNQLKLKSSTKEETPVLVSDNGLKSLTSINIELSSIDLDKDYEIGNYDLVNKEKDLKEINTLLTNVFKRSPIAENRKISKEPVTINAIENPEANRLDELNTLVRDNITRVSLTELLDANKKVFIKEITKTIPIKQPNIKKISNINYLEANIKLISEILKDTTTMDEKLKANVEKIDKSLKLELEKEILRRLTIDLIEKEEIILPEEPVIIEEQVIEEKTKEEKKSGFFSKLFKKKKKS